MIVTTAHPRGQAVFFAFYLQVSILITIFAPSDNVKGHIGIAHNPPCS